MNMGRHLLLLLTTAAATLPLNAAYVPQPLLPRRAPSASASRAAGFGLGPSSRHGRTRDGAKTTVLLDSTTMDFEMNLNLPGLVTDGGNDSNTIGGRPRKSLQVEGISEDGGDEGSMFQDLMRAVARNGSRQDAEVSAEDAPAGAVVNLTDMPDLLSLELPTSNDGKTVVMTKPKRKAAAAATKRKVKATRAAAADEDDVLTAVTGARDAPKKKKKWKKVTATIRDTGQDSMKHYLKSMGNHDLLNKNEEIILAREIQILIGWEETRVDLEARLSR